MPEGTSGAEVRFERNGRLGLIALDRPKALNALTFAMIGAIAEQLRRWRLDEAVAAVAIRGEGGKAFCAGGDVRAMWERGRYQGVPGLPGALSADFYREEYRLNRAIHRYPKPFVALIDGIVMGGGVGLSVNGRYRVATEHALFAMPETAIGLFPDVGGSHFLSRCPGRIGLYLGLTGARLRAADMVYAGLATHFVPRERLDGLTAALAAGDAATALTRHAADPGPAPLAEQRAAIDRCFARADPGAILAALAAEKSDWARATESALRRTAPLSCAVACRQIALGAGLEFEDCMRMEYRLSQAFMARPDFFEGVRAALIERDNKPSWNPARIEDVTPAMVEACFAPLGPHELEFDD